MIISPLSKEDYNDVLTLNELSVPHVSSIGMQDVDWFANNAAFFRVAHIDDAFAGYLIGLRPGTTYKSLNYRWFCEHYKDFAYIDRVAVAASARRHGVASALYDAFEASQRDASVLTCEVNLRPPNDASMQYHLRRGFRQVGTQELDGGSKEVAMLEKQL